MNFLKENDSFMKKINKILVNKNASIKETMAVIDRGAIKIAFVVDDSQKLLGTVTDGDIRRGILRGINIDENISKVMNKDPKFIYDDMPKDEILAQFDRKSMIGLPIVNRDNVVKNFVLLSEGTEILYFNEINQQKHLNRILIIGGCGYIGSILVRQLLKKGYKVTVLDNFTYGKESLDEIKTDANLKIIEGDTRHIEDLSLAMKNVDAVVHLAELVGDPACALNPSTTQEINYIATRTIALMCKYYQINRLVYASSCSVYGTSTGENCLTEESYLNPVSLYAKMKIASEKALMELIDENFSPTILRLATVFGFSYRPRFDLVVNLLTAKAICDHKITIFGGDQWRPNVHVKDVAKTIVSVLEAPINIVGGCIFNVGSNENNYKINKLGDLIKKEIPTANLIIEDNEVDKRDYKVDFSKLKDTLNIKMSTVKDGIREIKTALEKDKDLDYKDRKFSNIKMLEENNVNIKT